MCTKGSGTNSEMPPLRFCRSRRAARWRAQCAGVSTCPNMSVDVYFGRGAWQAAQPGMPKSCQVPRQGPAQRGGTLLHLQRAEGVHVYVWCRSLGGSQQAQAGGGSGGQRAPPLERRLDACCARQAAGRQAARQASGPRYQGQNGASLQATSITEVKGIQVLDRRTTPMPQPSSEALHTASKSAPLAATGKLAKHSSRRLSNAHRRVVAGLACCSSARAALVSRRHQAQAPPGPQQREQQLSAEHPPALPLLHTRAAVAPEEAGRCNM
ncbi:hypothetical protein ACK3TF_005859 [Chlorella vulgaris]